MSENGTMKARRPQLADSIEKLDEMIDALSTAIPGAVADSVREALGAFAAGLTTAVKDAVREAVAEAVRGLAATGATAPSPPPPPAPPPTPPAPPKPNVWAKAKTALGRLKKAAAKTFAPAVARVAVGWAVVKVVGGATAKSRTASLVTAAAGILAGLAGYAAGPVPSAVLLGLVTGMSAAVAVWAAPAAELLVAMMRDDGTGGVAA